MQVDGAGTVLCQITHDHAQHVGAGEHFVKHQPVNLQLHQQGVEQAGETGAPTGEARCDKAQPQGGIGDDDHVQGADLGDLFDNGVVEIIGANDGECDTAAGTGCGINLMPVVQRFGKSACATDQHKAPDCQVHIWPVSQGVIGDQGIDSNTQ